MTGADWLRAVRLAQHARRRGDLAAAVIQEARVASALVILPPCAVRGHHSRAVHLERCRPAIDAAWREERKP